MNNYDESGITQTVDFNYTQVDSDLSAEVNEQTDYDAILEMHRRVWAWVYQPPCENLDGFVCRCIIAAWVFVPQLRSYSQREIAARFGKKKQSLNRWIVEFKKQFPEIGEHIQHVKK